MKKFIVLLSALLLSACTLAETTDEYFRTRPSIELTDFREPYIAYNTRTGRSSYFCVPRSDVLVRFRNDLYCTDRFTASRMRYYRLEN